MLGNHNEASHKMFNMLYSAHQEDTEPKSQGSVLEEISQVHV